MGSPLFIDIITLLLDAPNTSGIQQKKLGVIYIKTLCIHLEVTDIDIELKTKHLPTCGIENSSDVLQIT